MIGGLILTQFNEKIRSCQNAKVAATWILLLILPQGLELRYESYHMIHII